MAKDVLYEDTDTDAGSGGERYERQRSPGRGGYATTKPRARRICDNEAQGEEDIAVIAGAQCQRA
jgi:hypothetical protein